MKANSLKSRKRYVEAEGRPEFSARVRVTYYAETVFCESVRSGVFQCSHNNSQGVTESVLVDNVNKCIANDLRFW